jgi:CHAT domain-containing protein/Tfp pilus assembly protein PilF
LASGPSWYSHPTTYNHIPLRERIVVRSLKYRAAVLLLILRLPHLSFAQTIEELDQKAREAYAAHDYKTAAEFARRIYDAKAKTSPPDSFELATAALNLGKSLVLADQSTEGAIFVGKACEIARKRFGDADKRLGSCLMELTDAQLKAEQYAEAKITADNALIVIKQAYPLDGYAAAAFHLGELFHIPQTLAYSATFFELATRLYGPTELNDTAYLDTSLTELGTVEYEQESYRQAAAHLERAHELDVKSSSDTSANGISKSYMLAESYSHTGDFERGLKLLDQVAAALESVNVSDHISANDIFFRIAELQEANGGTSEALETYQNILKRAHNDEQKRNLADQIRASYLSAEVYDKQHNTAQAERYFRDALQSTSVQEDKNSYEVLHVEVLQEFSQYLLRHGRFGEAHLQLEEALKLAEKTGGKKSTFVAGLLERMAVGLISSNDCESALPLMQRASDIYEKEDPESGAFIQSLKITAICITDSAARAALTRRALDLQFKATRTIDAGLAREEAQEYYRLGKLPMAEKAALLALNLDSSDTVAHDVMANIYADQNQLKQAIAMQQKAVALAAAQYGDDAIVVAGRRFNLGKLFLRTNDNEDALLTFEAAAKSFYEHIEQSLASSSLGEQRQLLIGQATAQTSGLLSACQRGSCLGSTYQWLVRWKGLLIAGLRREKEIAGAAALSGSKTALNWQTSRSQLAEWSASRGAIPYNEWKSTNDRLLHEKEQYERQLIAEMKSPLSETRISFEQLQKALHPHEVFIDIYRFNQFGRNSDSLEGYGAILTTSESGPKFVTIGTARSVDGAVDQWRRNIDEKSSGNWLSLLSSIWEPIRRALPPGSTVIRISPDGALSRIPWHSMASGTSRVLEITEIESARALISLRSTSPRISSKSTLLLIGDLDYDAGRRPDTPGTLGKPFPHLDWAEKESISINETATKSGIEVTWERKAAALKSDVLKQMENKRYLHFATHGFAVNKEIDILLGRNWSLNAADKPSRDPLIDSGLALSGANVTDLVTHQTSGIMTAEEILDDDLSASELVVLSACGTALGADTPGQGLEGLRSAFLASGARTLVMSLWNVNDEATALLMQVFYAELLHGGSVAGALHKAQGRVRNNAKFAAPRFWAGWVIVGAD